MAKAAIDEMIKDLEYKEQAFKKLEKVMSSMIARSDISPEVIKKEEIKEEQKQAKEIYEEKVKDLPVIESFSKTPEQPKDIEKEKRKAAKKEAKKAAEELAQLEISLKKEMDKKQKEAELIKEKEQATKILQAAMKAISAKKSFANIKTTTADAVTTLQAAMRAKLAKKIFADIKSASQVEKEKAIETQRNAIVKLQAQVRNRLATDKYKFIKDIDKYEKEAERNAAAKVIVKSFKSYKFRQMIKKLKPMLDENKKQAEQMLDVFLASNDYNKVLNEVLDETAKEVWKEEQPSLFSKGLGWAGWAAVGAAKLATGAAVGGAKLMTETYQMTKEKIAAAKAAKEAEEAAKEAEREARYAESQQWLKEYYAKQAKQKAEQAKKDEQQAMLAKEAEKAAKEAQKAKEEAIKAAKEAEEAAKKNEEIKQAKVYEDLNTLLESIKTYNPNEYTYIHDLYLKNTKTDDKEAIRLLKPMIEYYIDQLDLVSLKEYDANYITGWFGENIKALKVIDVEAEPEGKGAAASEFKDKKWSVKTIKILKGKNVTRTQMQALIDEILENHKQVLDKAIKFKIPKTVESYSGERPKNDFDKFEELIKKIIEDNNYTSLMKYRLDSLARFIIKNEED